MTGAAGDVRRPPARLPEPVLAARNLVRVLGGGRLADGRELSALPAEAAAALRDAGARFALPEGWRLGDRLTTVGDVAVLEVRGPEPAAVLKLSRSPAGTAILRLQHEVLTGLTGDARLGEWHRFLPQVLAHGAVSARCYTIEKAIPGTVGTSLPEPAIAGGAAHSALVTISALHRLTGHREVASPALVASWLDPALHRLAGVPMVLGRSRKLGLLAALRQRLHAGLVGRAVWVGRTHGDYYPGNVIYDPATLTVRGVIDWAQSRDGEPVWIDCMTLLLISRARQRGKELGDVVREACGPAAPPPADAALLAAHRAACPADAVDHGVMALLAWLRHVECNLAKSPRYVGNPVWVRRNIEQVLRAVGGRSAAG